MAVIQAVVSYPQKHIMQVLWEGLANGDTGSWENVARHGDKTVQMLGTFSSGTLTMQGSNDGGTTAAPVTDPQGNNIAKTAAALEAVLENPRAIRPSLAGGSGGDVDVYLICKA